MQADGPAESITGVVKAFIERELLYGEEGGLDDNTDLIGREVVDSVGLLRLVSFLEEQFHIQIQDEDLVPNNFRSPLAIEGLVKRYLNTRQEPLTKG